jgi:ferric-dicitrate binding protein FerR (iron transport regulator)
MDETARGLAAILLQRLTGEPMDEDEEVYYNDWLREHPEFGAQLNDLHGPDIIKLIRQYRRSEASTPRAYQELLKRTQRRRPSRVRYYYLSGVAAACLLTFAIIEFLHRTPPAPAPVLSVQQDLSPGTNKAVLTLSGGNTVVLDSTHNGLIQQQGGTNIVNQASGLLSYESKNSDHNPPLLNTVTTGRGGQYRLLLSDGTKVWLDAASSLRYPTAFNGKTREVVLTGQGYFEVAHHHEPFIVHTAGTDIQDLGTAFNVNAYPETGGVATTLLEGAVRVGSRTLKPGQQILVTPTGDQQLSDDVDLDEVVAWKDGRFQFTNIPFSTVLQYLSRWYDIDIRDHIDPRVRVVLTVPKNVPISVLMKVFEKTNRIRYKIDGKTMIVEPNQ